MKKASIVTMGMIGVMALVHWAYSRPARRAVASAAFALEPEAADQIQASRHELHKPLESKAIRHASRNRSEQAELSQSLPDYRVEGRCVSRDLDPLEGVQVSVLGEDREVAGTASTLADGSFSLPAGGSVDALLLRIQSSRIASFEIAVTGGVDAGHTMNAGDVVVPDCVQVGGVLQDEQGNPVPAIEVEIRRKAGHAQGQLKLIPAVATSGAAGLLSWGPLVPGEYSVHATGVSGLLTDSVLVQPGLESQHLEVVLADQASLPRVSGILTDPVGNPIAGAIVQCRGPKQTRFPTTTSTDGTFELRGNPDSEGVISLDASKPGYDLGAWKDVAKWRQDGLSLVLNPADPLVIRAVDAVDGSPIAQYGVRLLRLDGHPLAPIDMRSKSERIHSGNHDGGSLSIPATFSGRYEVRVEPSEGSRNWPSTFVATTVEPGILEEVVVELPRVATRRVRLADRHGEPAAGCEVRVCELEGVSDPASTKPVQPEDWGRYRIRNKAVLGPIHVADEAGLVQVTGPAGQPVRLLIQGPGCIASHQDLGRLEGERPLEIRVRRPGMVRVQPEPIHALEALTESLGVPVRLRFDSPENEKGGAPIALASSESTTEVALKPGLWIPVLILGRVESVLPRMQIGPEGQETLVLDLTEFLPAQVELSLELAGIPHILADVQLEHWSVGGAGTAPRWMESKLRTDAAGVLNWSGLPGRYRVVFPGEPGSTPDVLAQPGEFHLKPGEHFRESFAGVVSALEIRLIDQQGDPVSAVQGIEVLRASNKEHLIHLSPTDKEGLVRLDACEAGEVLLNLFPARVGTRKQRIEFLMAGGSSNALESLRIDLAKLELTAGQVVHQTIELPNEYFQ